MQELVGLAIIINPKSKIMTLTAEMLAPITGVITDNIGVLVGVVISIAGAHLLFKFIKKATR